MQQGISLITEEYVLLKKDIVGLLSKIDLETKTLPNDIRENLGKILTILKAEKLFKFDETALDVARVRKIIEEKKQRREEKQIAMMYDKLLRDCTKLRMNFDDLQRILDMYLWKFDTMKKRDNDLYSKKTSFSKRLTEYEQAAKTLNGDLCDMVHADLYPEIITHKYKLYLEKSSELVNVNQSLAQYCDLPPNLLQAKQLLENKMKEYEDLIESF